MSLPRKSLSHLTWVSSLLAGHRHRIRELMGRITDLGVVQAMTPKIFRNFLDLLDQVAGEKEKELSIISQIEAVERQHRYCRQHHQLVSGNQLANAPIIHSDGQEFEDGLEGEYPDKSSRLWFFLMLLYVSQNQNDKAKQRLNAG